MNILMTLNLRLEVVKQQTLINISMAYSVESHQRYSAFPIRFTKTITEINHSGICLSVRITERSCTCMLTGNENHAQDNYLSPPLLFQGKVDGLVSLDCLDRCPMKRERPIKYYTYTP